MMMRKSSASTERGAANRNQRGTTQGISKGDDENAAIYITPRSCTDQPSPSPPAPSFVLRKIYFSIIRFTKNILFLSHLFPRNGERVPSSLSSARSLYYEEGKLGNPTAEERTRWSDLFAPPPNDIGGTRELTSKSTAHGSSLP